MFYDCEWENDNCGGMMPYWHAFLETPHGTACTPDDFRRVNAALFPLGAERLEVCGWSTDWSDHFDGGHEWWRPDGAFAIRIWTGTPSSRVIDRLTDAGSSEGCHGI
ncbi:MAG: hypothetical protein J6P53_04455 [Mailhella sp.]|nr:hypothetical protein [Mailhella sp.]